MIRVYYHYANGQNYAGHHSRLFDSRERARSWVRWMEENRPGFVFDELNG